MQQHGFVFGSHLTLTFLFQSYEPGANNMTQVLSKKGLELKWKSGLISSLSWTQLCQSFQGLCEEKLKKMGHFYNLIIRADFFQ